MNDLHYVKIEFDKKCGSNVKIRATRAEIVQAVSSLVRNCVEEDLLPDLPGNRIPLGAKIGAAIATGINSTTLASCSMKIVYNDLIDALCTQLIEITDVKTMKGEN